jgi:hypothetical protein
MALKKHMLKVKLMSFALASQVVLLQSSSALLLHMTETTDCAIRNPIATVATNEEMARMHSLCHVRIVTLTTCIWRTSEASMQRATSVTKTDTATVKRWAAGVTTP